MEVKLCMDGGETIIMRPGCRWGRTWMDLRCTSWDLYRFEMGSECSWDIVITICMELRRHLAEGETRILEPVFRWDSTWMVMRHKSSSTNIGTLMVHRWRWYKNIGTSMLVTQDLELDAHLENWIGLKYYLDGTDRQFSWPGWSWGVIWMKMGRKCRDLDWGETRTGWRLDVNLWV